VALALAVAFGGVAAGGCADIWGFEGAVDLRDGGSSEPPGDACVCVPSAPAGWQGPFEIFEGTGAPGSAGPSCGSNYGAEAYVGFASPDAPAATCSCSCAAPASACASPVLEYFKDGQCTQSCDTASQTIGPGCTALGPSDDCKGGGTHYTIKNAAAMPGGSCTPVAAMSVAALTWMSRAHLCAATTPPTTAACTMGNVCAPATDDGFEPTTRCVVHEKGASPCPPGYPSSRTYYESAADDRGCTACTCGAASDGPCGNATVSLYARTDCSAGGVPIMASPACLPLEEATAAGPSANAPPSSACAPSGGQPTGMVSPTSLLTVCCTP
jgi:hypothetical protein